MSSTGFNSKARLGWGAVVVAFIMLLSACSGGGAENNAAGGGGGGISGTGARTVVTGSITGFGSVIIGGIHYTAKPDATVLVEGKTIAAENDLQHGMVVVLKGTFDSTSGSGTYDTIEYRSDLKGSVQNIDPLTGTIFILGQTVVVDTATVLDGLTDLSAISKGTEVEVSGTLDLAGKLHATRVFLKISTPAPTDLVKIKGRVSSVAPGSFTIGGQLISYTPGQTGFVNLNIADLSTSDTRLIEVTGSLSGVTLNATRIERREALAGTLESERLDVSGIVLSGDINSFVINTPNGPVTVAGAGAIIKNGTAANIQAGTKVEAVGKLSGGILIAREIKHERNHSIKLEGDVATIDQTGKTITINGITVVLSDQTILRDSSTARMRNFNLLDMTPGNHLQIGGSLDTTSLPNRVLATKVERFDPASSTFIQGPASEFTPQLIILGVAIVTNTDTSYRLGGTDLGNLAAFLGQITLNSSTIKAKGTFSGPPPQLTAIELEIQP